MSSSAIKPRRRSSARLSLASNVLDLPGVGSKRADILRNLGVETVGDLLVYPPRRYIDRQAFARIADLKVGQTQTVAGKIASVTVKFIRGRRLTVATVDDGSGNLACVWFSQPYLRRLFKLDTTYVFSGLVRQGRLGPSMVHPEYEVADAELLHTGRIVPVYRTRPGLSSRQMRVLVKAALGACAGEVRDEVPTALRKDLGLEELASAVRSIHFPPDPARAEAARRRLAFDEMLVFQTLFALARKERPYQDGNGRRAQDVVARFTARLPFDFTGAQKAALGDILADLASPCPMRRLLQGDVGCGKTVVAALAAAIVADGGGQVAVLCPTELLADQHLGNFSRFLRPFGLKVGLLTAGVVGSERAGLEADLADGTLAVVVGTHALIGEGLAIKNLRLVVVDEEQRFGVLQRTRLLRHAREAGLLVVSATPIPRTLALTAYGDLDVTTISEMPPGRGKHTTTVVREDGRRGALGEIAGKINAGLRGFYVCPALEDTSSGLTDVRTVKCEMEALLAPGRSVEILTGRTGRDRRARILDDFVAGKTGLIVATTVVEVGMDIPSATVLAVEQAERFGLSQLHQMRGRVARTSTPSFSYFLVSDGASDKAWARLRALEATSDGFQIAEQDLMLRGPGDLVGTRQHGIPDLKFALLPDDMDLLVRARDEAFKNVARGEPSGEWRDWIGAVGNMMEGKARIV
jgi:ATP-dependent DNA helicase RecG